MRDDEMIVGLSRRFEAWRFTGTMRAVPLRGHVSVDVESIAMPLMYRLTSKGAWLQRVRSS